MCLVFGRREERKPEIKCGERRFNAPGNWFINSVEGSAHLILCRAYGLSIFPFYSLGGKWPFSEPTLKTLSWAPGQPGRRWMRRVWGRPLRESHVGGPTLSPLHLLSYDTHTHTSGSLKISPPEQQSLASGGCLDNQTMVSPLGDTVFQALFQFLCKSG